MTAYVSIKEAPSVLILCAPSNYRQWPVPYGYENGGLRIFSCFVRFLVNKLGINSEKCLEYGQ